MRPNARLWTQEDLGLALEMRAQKPPVTYAKIGKILNRHPGAVECKIKKRHHAHDERRPKLEPANGIKLSEELASDRARRAQLAPRDLTAALCGDPLPGYSMFDRRDSPQAAPAPRRATTLFLDQLAMRRAGG